MRSVRSISVCLALAALLLAGAVARADTIAYDLRSTPGSALLATGDLLISRFTTSAAIEITALGTANTNTTRSQPLALGLYDDTGRALATVTLPVNGTTAVGRSQFVQLATPVQIAANQTFRVAGFYVTGTYYQVFLSPSASVTFNSLLTYDNGYDEPHPFPTSLAGSVPEAWNTSNLEAGPNFEFAPADTAAVPLPSSACAGLALLGALGALSLTRSRKLV